MSEWEGKQTTHKVFFSSKHAEASELSSEELNVIEDEEKHPTSNL